MEKYLVQANSMPVPQIKIEPASVADVKPHIKQERQQQARAPVTKEKVSRGNSPPLRLRIKYDHDELSEMERAASQTAHAHAPAPAVGADVATQPSLDWDEPIEFDAPGGDGKNSPRRVVSKDIPCVVFTWCDVMDSETYVCVHIV